MGRVAATIDAAKRHSVSVDFFLQLYTVVAYATLVHLQSCYSWSLYAALSRAPPR